FRSADPAYEDGGQMRDFLFVGDAVRVVRWLLEHPETRGIFNVGTGKARSFADLAKAVFAAAGSEAHIEYVDMPPELAGSYQYFTQAPMQRLREAGYGEAFTSLEAGISEYVAEHLFGGALRR
ncbi:MAG: NAD-dependent epimerase/dehydratase family protein, partial [Caulobacteraceae bacterium]